MTQHENTTTLDETAGAFCGVIGRTKTTTFPLPNVGGILLATSQMRIRHFVRPQYCMICSGLIGRGGMVPDGFQPPKNIGQAKQPTFIFSDLRKD